MQVMRTILGWIALPVVNVYCKRSAVEDIPILLEDGGITVAGEERYFSKLHEFDYKGIIWVRGSGIYVAARSINEQIEVVKFGPPPLWRPLSSFRAWIVVRKAVQALKSIRCPPPNVSG